MPSNQPRYAVYDLEYKTADGRNESKLVFVMYSPDNCTQGQLRFIYAQNKDAVKAKVSPVHKELQVNDPADLNEAEWISDFQWAWSFRQELSSVENKYAWLTLSAWS